MAAPFRSTATACLRRPLIAATRPVLLPRPESHHAAAATRAPSPRWHSTSSSSSTSSSVNPDEVSHFNALAADWWDPHGSSRLLHLMNPLRHDFINACLASQPEPRPSSLTYLDIGCGGGIFAESAARLPSTSRVTAIDPTPSVLAVARAHARKDPGLAAKLSYRQCSVEELDVPTPGYDVVSVFEVIEHIDHPAAFLDKVRPFVRPGGWLVMSTIARTWMSWFTTNLVAEDLLRIVPPGTHDWNKYINEDELRRYFMDKGWNSPRVMGVVYVPGVGWREVRGSEKVGNYFFAVRRDFES
ncbi:Hexaprenyldihydroxybenzoate methyltransferase-like protein [Hapsidospora chrysogenum ATCC 11550]|uniref:Ubiquinone biosynthesis O-methyltransferase, mitochondrial n=1 Tax=Hapsidospora chrysogenum (strain ATCC 11550 / CBS 779.69 / DSM 880 / IAM 14645 / JCM 23072 / IMI 49137) TaxID=857340 RepID=A0A086SVK7_HAPC1|nr:Hexaprenyldihydroxybenzoate methyltransferase-like protein [Hapsidospora chrysogenum ATCC 11550]